MMAHLAPASLLDAAGKTLIDLTPAPDGVSCVPSLNAEPLLTASNINMITCGGQVSIPIAQAMAEANSDVRYIEVVSSISAENADPATRLNISHYLEKTETA